jgi:outer membrane immunogenic protein
MMKLALTLSLLLATAAPAAAADLSEASPDYGKPAAAPLLWSGPYLGIDGGYGWGSTSHSFSIPAPSGNSNPNGGIGGVYAGYNFQMGHVVTGLEADIEAADLNGSYSNATFPTSTGSSRLDWDASLRGRLGAAFGPSLPYLTGGVAFAGYNFTGGPLPSLAPCCGNFSSTLTGWTVGAGWDYAFTRHLVGRIEYRYTDYGKAHGELLPAQPGIFMATSNTTSVVRVGLSYKY